MQGDNYRVAASTHEGWLTGLSPVQPPVPPNNAGLIKHASGEPIVLGAQVSELLTVWRTLHLEMDRIVTTQAQVIESALEHKGNFTYLGCTSLPDPPPPTPCPPNRALRLENTGDATPLYAGADSSHGPGHSQLDAWRGGVLRLNFHPPGADHLFFISSSFRQTVDVAQRPNQGDLWNGLSEAAANAVSDRGYGVRDDEVAPLNDAVNLTLAHSIFASVYIRLAVQDQSAAQSQFEFSLKQHRNIPNIGVFPANKYTATWYWSAQVVDAYEGIGTADADSRHAPALEEISLAHAGSGPVENVPGTSKMKIGYMRENIADYRRDTPTHIPVPPAGSPQEPLVLSPQVDQRAIAHELMHVFGLRHTGAIMCFHRMVQSAGTGGTITPAQAQQLRLAKQTTHPSDNDSCQTY